jgi:hypothetical protein
MTPERVVASLFHPDGPNDLAPVDYNLQAGAAELPRSPLPPNPARPASAGRATTRAAAFASGCRDRSRAESARTLHRVAAAPAVAQQRSRQDFHSLARSDARRDAEAAASSGRRR